MHYLACYPVSNKMKSTICAVLLFPSLLVSNRDDVCGRHSGSGNYRSLDPSGPVFLLKLIKRVAHACIGSTFSITNKKIRR